MDGEDVAAVVALVLLTGAAGLGFWAMWRYTTLTERLHPLTPAQRRAKRRIYALMLPVAAITLALMFGLAQARALVVVGVLAGILLLDVILTPLLHYRRAKRGARR